MEKDIKDETTKEKLLTAKREFASRQHDLIQKSDSLNKFVTGVYNLLVKSVKKGEDKIIIEKNEIENAIQQGINNYFSDFARSLPSS